MKTLNQSGEAREVLQEIERFADNCFYVGSSVKPFFLRGLKITSLSLRLKGHPFAVGLLPDQHAPERGVKVAQRRRETLTPRRGMLSTLGRGEYPVLSITFCYMGEPFWLGGSGESMVSKTIQASIRADHGPDTACCMHWVVLRGTDC